MTKEEAQNLKTFKHYCSCGGTARSNNDPRRPHLHWCPQKDEYNEWYDALNDENEPIFTKEQAIEFYDSGAWEYLSPIDLVRLQFREKYLFVPFDKFLNDLEIIVCHPVCPIDLTEEYRHIIIKEIAEKYPNLPIPHRQEFIEKIEIAKRSNNFTKELRKNER